MSNNALPADILELFPEHLREQVQRCSRCDKAFVPCGGPARTRCLACTKQAAADSNLIRMAFGQEYR